MFVCLWLIALAENHMFGIEGGQRHYQPLSLGSLLDRVES